MTERVMLPEAPTNEQLAQSPAAVRRHVKNMYQQDPELRKRWISKIPNLDEKDRHNPDVHAALVPHLVGRIEDDGDPGVREAAAEALGWMVLDARDIPEAIGHHKVHADRIHQCLLKAIQEGGPKYRLASALVFMRDPRVFHTMAKALKEKHHPQFQAVLRDFFEMKHAQATAGEPEHLLGLIRPLRDEVSKLSEAFVQLYDESQRRENKGKTGEFWEEKAKEVMKNLVTGDPYLHEAKKERLLKSISGL